MVGRAKRNLRRRTARNPKGKKGKAAKRRVRAKVDDEEPEVATYVYKRTFRHKPEDAETKD